MQSPGFVHGAPQPPRVSASAGGAAASAGCASSWFSFVWLEAQPTTPTITINVSAAAPRPARCAKFMRPPDGILARNPIGYNRKMGAVRFDQIAVPLALLCVARVAWAAPRSDDWIDVSVA